MQVGGILFPSFACHGLQNLPKISSWNEEEGHRTRKALKDRNTDHECHLEDMNGCLCNRSFDKQLIKMK